MPTTNPPPKHDLGPAALKWLKENVGIPVEPPVRTSTWESILHNPFIFLLASRFGIVPALRYSEALSYGGWFHVRAEDWTSAPAEGRAYALDRFALRRTEIREACTLLGKGPEAQADIIEEERQDLLNACTLFDVAFNDIPTGWGKPLSDLLTCSHLRDLGAEILVEHEYAGHPCCTRIDRLLYNTATNQVIPIDWKTTSDPTVVRLSTVPAEFQTQHTMHLLNWNLQLSDFRNSFDLPPDVTLGPMYHIAVRKPAIRLCSKDAPLTRYISDGKRKKVFGVASQNDDGSWTVALDYPDGIGQSRYFESDGPALEWMHAETGKKPEAQREGEPDPELFRRRLKDWALGTGDYEHLRAEREADPIVNISTFSAENMKNEAWSKQYIDRLEECISYCRCPATPSAFPSSASSLRSFGSLSPYAPFSLSYDVGAWPEIIERNGFLVGKHRPI